jgi:hypothetical protein
MMGLWDATTSASFRKLPPERRYERLDITA